MSKRKINQQQQRRITARQVQITSETPDALEGLVISRFGHHAEVLLSNQYHIHCAIRTNLEDLVVGDKVICLQESQGQGVIIRCLPRDSVFTRYDARNNEKIIAANITQMIIVMAPVPKPNLLLLDASLVKAHYHGLRPIIVMNKSDLTPAHPEIGALYQALGYTYFETSCTYTQGLDALHQVLQQHISVFTGQSGVGKSSIIQYLLPDHNITIADQQHQHGRHTTSAARLYPLGSECAIIDAPGIRTLALTDLPARAILPGFVEFHALAQHCRFRNCDHHHSAGCAITTVLHNKQCNEGRYQRLLDLLAHTRR